MDQPTILIIADEPDFARALMGRWQSERQVPAFTVMSSDLWSRASAAVFHLAVVGTLRSGRIGSILKALDAASVPVIHLASDDAAAQTVRANHPRVLVLHAHDTWADSLVLVASEVLRRVEVQARLRKAEQSASAAQRNATLGSYMLEMRHSLNNALTSVLGNAELLLLDPHVTQGQIRDQIDTIHNMALRIHEILQRFSSLDSEMQFAEKASQSENRAASHAFVQGS